MSSFLRRLYMAKPVTIAAVGGHCPAGGCLLALCSDYRIITTDADMGLNEVGAGIPVPFYNALIKQMAGQRSAEGAPLATSMDSSARLLELGMADEVVGSVDALLPRALAVGAEWLKVPRAKRAQTKANLRKDFYECWAAMHEEETRTTWRIVNDEKVVASLGAVLASHSGSGERARAKL
eukprot:NODE_23872_length_648_cov_2.287908.p1 GENE.NODE_23872_length_648_cov_2.287908~~NODE_23872_length_648_cov_2.287908.p1  ORF type:complete len:180 (+),score=49.45 NODE_23872_length_648_cov_2.287908:2-541(+)